MVTRVRRMLGLFYRKELNKLTISRSSEYSLIPRPTRQPRAYRKMCIEGLRAFFLINNYVIVELGNKPSK